MTPEELKQKWASLRDCPSTPLDTKLLSDIVYNRLTSTLDRITARYRRFTILALAMGLMMIMMYFSGHGHEIFEGPIALEFAAYFLLCASIDGYLWRTADKIDINTMTTGEMASRTRRLRLVHLTSMILIIPFAAVIIYQMFRSANQYTRFGMIAGGCLGLAVGLNLLFKMLRDYRTLIHQ